VIIAALVIGLVTAYYFGVRLGGYAAAAAGGLFLLAAVWPSKALVLYGIAAVGFLGVLMIGPKRQVPGAKADVMRLLGKTLGWVRRRFK
jgi:hypothetical protein